ncbi:MAG: 3-hydroxyacyl-CoA dehydrogenase/enoyl-CoA hydratase family protein [Gammaproteobacteria bacterium]|nr:3-hydroxyacyl-CoA dehydrogenase/enoyl-CoA hydratase family protein [Gammaproteobacteria bacterium]
MIQKKYPSFRRVAILGAGVMGAQVAALFANANVEVLLFEIPAKEGNLNALAEQARQKLRTLNPPPLVSEAQLEAITPVNYEEHCKELKTCDFILEAIGEHLDWKKDLYQKISGYLKEEALLASNTSGLSLAELADVLPPKVRPRFCGVHFFNPPRYMTLVELIAHSTTDPENLNRLETFLVSALGKGVIRAYDTPNFLANRMGVFSFLAILHHAEKWNLSIPVVDHLTGPLIGRPKSATYRTLDVVGLDTMAYVVHTMQERLPDDPWHSYFKVPGSMAKLIERGALGQKSKQGFYRKRGEAIEVFDPKTLSYQPVTQKASAEVVSLLEKTPSSEERFRALRESNHVEAQFLWALTRDLFHYSAFHLASIADLARDLDLSLRWGFGWKEGPFETWQKAGWHKIARWIQEDIQEDKTPIKAPLPVWVSEQPEPGVYQNNRAFCPKRGTLEPRSQLAVYRRQYYPDPICGESFEEGKTVFENEGVRLWQRREELAVLSFKSKLGAMNLSVLEGILESISYAEQTYSALIIWQRQGPYFSVGANLKEVLELIKEKSFDKLEQFIERFQETTSRVRYATLPVVAAVQGYALGGGCELLLHAARRVAAMESQIGLVESGVGLIPAGGGTKEMAVQAAHDEESLKAKLKMLLSGFPSRSAEQARERRFLKDGDVILMNARELLYIAEQEALALSESYRPALKSKIKVVGKPGIDELQKLCDTMVEQKQMPAYDKVIGYSLAEVLCGGSVETGTLVSESDLLELEKNNFLELAYNVKTVDRIEYMLKTGKRLLN